MKIDEEEEIESMFISEYTEKLVKQCIADRVKLLIEYGQYLKEKNKQTDNENKLEKN